MSQIREYEVTILLHPSMDDEGREQFVKSFTEILTHEEGEGGAPVFHNWGKRDLAYEIQKQNDAYYLFFEAKLDGTKIRDIERDLNYDESILRFLFVRKEEYTTPAESKQ